ncbi:Septin [Popillia japonica]|uniref:Septin n=1 Tax=Popillia japonica TaxID=7064 RepID=A0AAW1MFF6_POPJA
MATAVIDPYLENQKEINILLLSESGVGKSTFVNSLVNYLQFNTFNDACKEIKHLRCVIPTKFTVTDDHFNEKSVEFGSNDNESTATGVSATLKAKSYKMELPESNLVLRIIDTPGVGDTRAKRNGINLGNETIFANSFAHSRNEYMRLIDVAKSATPYILTDILYLYITRQKFEEFCHLLTTKLNAINNDSVLLKKVQTLIDDNDSTENTDLEYRINEIESRMSKAEFEKDNLILEISKFVMFLQTNSILLFNDYCIQYVNYLIDQEMSKGFLADNNTIKNYRNMINYHENIQKVIEMDVNVDPFSLLMTRDELSSSYPQLEDELNKINDVYYNEVLISVNKVVSQEKPVIEEVTRFDFDKWYQALQEQVLPLLNNAEEAYSYEELRKSFVKQDHTNAKTKKNLTDNLTNQSFKSGFCNRKTSSDTYRDPGEFIVHQKERHRNERNNKSEDFVYVNKSKNDFVFLHSDTTQHSNRGVSHGRGRGGGRGRGRGRGNASGQPNEHHSKQKNSNRGNQRNAPNTSRPNSSREEFSANPNVQKHTNRGNQRNAPSTSRTNQSQKEWGPNPNVQKHSNRGNQRTASSTSRPNSSRQEYDPLRKNVFQSMKNMFD